LTTSNVLPKQRLTTIFTLKAPDGAGETRPVYRTVPPMP